MSTSNTQAPLSQTARQECTLLGHQEVDVEHVFLAAMHNPHVARMLARHGVTLEGTRQQAQGRSHPSTEFHHEATGDFPVSERARRLLADARSTPQVVLAALDLPDGAVPALLERQGADVEWVHASVARLAAGPLANEPGHELIDGDPGPSNVRSRLFLLPWEQVWPHVSTAEGARAWLPSDDGTRVSGPGELSGQLRIGGAPKGTYVWRLLDAVSPSAQEPGHVLWQEDWQLTGRGRSGPGRWTHLTLTPVEDGTQVDLMTGSVRPGRFQRLLRPVARLGQAVGGRSTLHQLGQAVEAAGPPATRRQE